MSLYYHIRVILLLFYYLVRVIMLSLYYHIRVILLLFYYLVRVIMLSLYYHIRVIVLSLYYRIRVRAWAQGSSVHPPNTKSVFEELRTHLVMPGMR